MQTVDTNPLRSLMTMSMALKKTGLKVITTQIRSVFFKTPLY